MKNKLRNESGATMLLAIFLIALVSIVIISFSAQVGNQVKSTRNIDEDIAKKYQAEGNIEKELGGFISSIKVNPSTYLKNDEVGNIIKSKSYNIIYNDDKRNLGYRGNGYIKTVSISVHNGEEIAPEDGEKKEVQEGKKLIKVTPESEIAFTLDILHENDEHRYEDKREKINKEYLRENDVYKLNSKIKVIIKNLTINNGEENYEVSYSIDEWKEVR